ncbi:MAG: hypothetical protein Q9217_002844 [Psora testacea]
MDHLRQYVQSKGAIFEQYGPSEINAELLRQEIRELEKESLDPARKHKIFSNAERIKLLKQQLQEVQSFADLSAQSRIVGKEWVQLYKHMMEAKEIPPGAEHVLDRYLALMDALEEREKATRQARRSQIIRWWSNSSWTLRMQLLQWYWRKSSYRFFRVTISRKISRGGVRIFRRFL